MNKKILIITSDPNSINYEIIKKNLNFFKKKKNNDYLFIGCEKRFRKNVTLNKKIEILHIEYKNKKKYLEDSFKKATDLIIKKEAQGLINLPLNKKEIFGQKFPGVTEFISKQFNCSGRETMLLYGKNFAVSPVTTHIKLKEVSKKINKKKIINNLLNIYQFYKNIIGIKNPKITILGLNPHSGIDLGGTLEENNIIKPAIRYLKKKINIIGPLSADTAFLDIKKKRTDCIVGIYHDQVLPTFKYANNFHGINITLGLPFLRVSPDHGTATDLIGKNLANHQSFLYSLNFFENFYKKI